MKTSIRNALAEGNLIQGEYPLDARGYPEPETIQALNDELDYLSAVQTYLWAFPQMVVAGPTERKTNDEC